jgi:hypothetical protein
VEVERRISGRPWPENWPKRYSIVVVVVVVVVVI